MALSSKSVNLFPVGDKFVLFQMDLGGILGMGLLQALCITTQCVNLMEIKILKKWKKILG